MAEAALGIALAALIASIIAAFATWRQADASWNLAETARRQTELLDAAREEAKRANIAVTRVRVDRDRPDPMCVFFATNVGRTHARYLRARLADHRRMALSDTFEFKAPLEPGETKEFDVYLRPGSPPPLCLVLDWSDESGDLQEKIEYVDDLFR